MFQLAKVWVDYVPTNHTVEIRYTWSKLDQRPRWSGDEEAEVMSVLPNTNPPTRLAVLEITRYLDKKAELPFALSVWWRRRIPRGLQPRLHRGDPQPRGRVRRQRGPHYRGARALERRWVERSELVAGEAERFETQRRRERSRPRCRG